MSCPSGVSIATIGFKGMNPVDSNSVYLWYDFSRPKTLMIIRGMEVCNYKILNQPHALAVPEQHARKIKNNPSSLGPDYTMSHVKIQKKRSRMPVNNYLRQRYRNLSIVQWRRTTQTWLPPDLTRPRQCPFTIDTSHRENAGIRGRRHAELLTWLTRTFLLLAHR